MTQEKLDNQRDVVKNERRWSVDNQPYGTLGREAAGPALPARPSVSPLDHRLDGGSRRGLAGRRARVLHRPLRAEQRGTDDRGRLRSRSGAGDGREALRTDPGEPCHPRGSSHRGRSRYSAPRCARWFRIGCRCHGSTRHTACRSSGPRASTRSRWQSTCSASGRASRLYRSLVREQQVRPGRDHLRLPGDRRGGDLHPLGHRASRRRPRSARGSPVGGGRQARHRWPERRRAGAGPQPARRRRRIEPGANQRTSRSALDVRLPLR